MLFFCLPLKKCSRVRKLWGTQSADTSAKQGTTVCDLWQIKRLISAFLHSVRTISQRAYIPMQTSMARHSLPNSFSTVLYLSRKRRDQESCRRSGECQNFVCYILGGSLNEQEKHEEASSPESEEQLFKGTDSCGNHGPGKARIAPCPAGQLQCPQSSGASTSRVAFSSTCLDRSPRWAATIRVVGTSPFKHFTHWVRSQFRDAIPSTL